ncbi:hypothetical protein POM88_025008 [Heracleum sosnowskyi]|uniref:DUF4283 domain-containing protein n=1 Tax=Heracleum sosnowskyi TaxID=360622 RepID=A0AAD8I351_9APIA|nr:hypothetical protein POM88_025008 [Heracleum sosnowskyi]
MLYTSVNINVNDKARVWVRFSRVPFLYWTVKGLCLLGLAVGKLIGMDRGTHRAAVRNEPSLEARMLIEVGVLDPLQNFILVDVYAVNRKSKVFLTYECPSVCGYCCVAHSGICDLLQECFLDTDGEPQTFRLVEEDSGISMYHDNVHSSDSDAESSRLKIAEFEYDFEPDHDSEDGDVLQSDMAMQGTQESNYKRKRDHTLQGSSGAVDGSDVGHVDAHVYIATKR